MHEIDKVIEAATAIIRDGRRGVLVTIVGTSGSTYRRPGARAVISETGQAFGMISGGCVEKDLAVRVASWLDDPKPRLLRYDSSSNEDIVFGLGLGCRGEIELLIEPFDVGHPPRLMREFRWNGREAVSWTTTFEGRELLVEAIRPEQSLVVFGGRDAAPVARMAELVNWKATVISARDVRPEDVASKVDLSQFDAAVVMTHNFLHDADLLSALLASPISYVGLLGPRRRGEELLAHLGFAASEWAHKLYSPIGLDLGAETPEEIALSIVAEIQSVLSRRDPRPLREVDAPIHAREILACR